MEEPIIKQLLNSLPQQGRVSWIGVRPERRAPLVSVASARIWIGKGLEGDHFSGSAASKRQLTLIQGEHLDAVASMLSIPEVEPAWVRRNIVVRGINLLALKNQRFYIGNVLLEYSGLCHPCSRMEEILGAGGYNAMRGHGGITAKVLSEGEIKTGDKVVLAEKPSPHE
jgi:MOSC domain-containing protein YiiM